MQHYINNLINNHKDVMHNIHVCMQQEENIILFNGKHHIN